MVVTPSLVLELLLPLLVLLPIAAVLRCVPSSRRRNQQREPTPVFLHSVRERERRLARPKDHQPLAAGLLFVVLVRDAGVFKTVFSPQNLARPNNGVSADRVIVSLGTVIQAEECWLE